MPALTMGSLFDGIGVFPLAASRHGIVPVWASEIVPDAISITKRHFPEMIASVDKGTHACEPDWAAVCRVIVLDIRQYVCVLCLADNAPDQPASPSEFFTEDKRRLARQTRQAGCRPPTRITTPDVVLPREKPCVPLSTDATFRRHHRAIRQQNSSGRCDHVWLTLPKFLTNWRQIRHSGRKIKPVLSGNSNY